LRLASDDNQEWEAEMITSASSGAIRPFVPTDSKDVGERSAHALESIAVALAHIDHNFQLSLQQLEKIAITLKSHP
jgi:hypothetical protein